MPLDYRQYFDLEAYLFEEVSPRFHKEGSIDDFDFFSIVIWKANRAKSKTAKRLREATMSSGESPEALCRRMTSEVFRAKTPEARFKILTSEPWGFALAMASAILTVLYPDDFTVYDYRVCEELKDFSKLKYLTDPNKLWIEYSRFIEAVKAASAEARLRDKDRFLSGRSAAEQLKRDIHTWFDSASES